MNTDLLAQLQLLTRSQRLMDLRTEAKGLRRLQEDIAAAIPAERKMQEVIRLQTEIAALVERETALPPSLVEYLRQYEQVRRLDTINRQFAELVVGLDWPPPWHLPARVVQWIVSEYNERRLSQEQVVDALMLFYQESAINDLLSDWRRQLWLGNRIRILEEGIANHIAGRFFGSVCTLLPQIEGVLGDELGRKPNPQNDAARLFRKTPLSEVAKNFYVRLAKDSFDWRGGSPLPSLSRSAILHGRAVDYGTSQHSLKIVLIVDAVIAAVANTRRGRP